MRVGDVLEWLACGAFIAGAYLATSLPWTAVVVAGVCLAYEAQCYAGHDVPTLRPRWLRLPRRKAKT